MRCKIKIVKFITVCFILAYMQGCYYDKEELLYPGSTQAVDCSTVAAKFSDNVSPVIISKCATSTCHAPGNSSGLLVIENYTQVRDKLDRIQARAIIERTMPPTGPLSPTEINILKCWIESGAPNN